MAVAEYLSQLQKDKQALAKNLFDKGVEVKDNETFTTLVPKVATIETASPIEEYIVIEPSTKHQTFRPAEGYDGIARVELVPVQSNIDENIIPDNIREGATILGVTGVYDGVKDLDLQDKSVNPTSNPEGVTVEVDSNYDALGKVKVNPIQAWMVNGLTPDKVKKGEEILELVGTYGPTSQVKQVAPTKSGFTVYPDGNIEFLQKVIIEPVTARVDSNIAPNNIRLGVEILGITGKFDGDYKFQEKVVTASKEDMIELTPDSGYDAMTKVYVNRVTSGIDYNIRPENIKKGIEILNVVGTYEPAPSQTSKFVYPRVYEQIIRPDTGYGTLDQVVVGEVTAGIDSSIKPDNIRKGVTILDVEGTMESVNAHGIYVDPSINEKTYYPLEGYNSISTVTVNPVTATIDDRIVPTNIKKGVSILGVEGTYDGGVANLQIKEVLPTDGTQDINADNGFDALSRVTVLPTPTEDIVINPSVENQTINRTPGLFINKIEVPKVTSEIDRNIIPENIKMNMSILGVIGTYDGGLNDYFGAIPAGTSGCPGVAKSILNIPETIAFSTANGSYAFSGLTQITTIPKLDYSNLTVLDYMFKDTKMSDITQFVIPEKATSAKGIFSGCTFPAGTYDFYLPKVTELNFLNGIKFSSRTKTTVNITLSSPCTNCKNFLSNRESSNPGYINLFSDGAEIVTNMSGFIQGSYGIISVSCDDNIKPTSLERFNHYNSYDRNSEFKYFKANLDRCTNMSEMFRGGRSPDTMEITGESRNLTTVYRMCYEDWYDDYLQLKEVKGQMYGDKLVDVRQCFYNQKYLTTFWGFKNFGKGFTSTTTNYNYYKLDLSASTNLTYESLINIVNNLYDLNITYGVYDADGNPGSGTLVRQALVLGSTNLAKLTDEEKAIATNKGWNLS